MYKLRKTMVTSVSCSLMDMEHTWNKKTRNQKETACSADPGVEGKLIEHLNVS
jgi:hypothetical protein